MEKPDAQTARGYVDSGEYRWNAGMFVVRASVLLELLRRWHPALAAGVEAIADDLDLLGERWGELAKIAIDHAVAEPAADAGRVAVIPAPFTWDDVGDFDSLAALLDGAGRSAAEPASGVRVLGPDADVVAMDSTALVAPRSGRLVALVGVDDLVVVDTPDALLVVPRSRAQQVKALVDRLAADGRSDLL